jgi:opacity protein-like surface antigen
VPTDFFADGNMQYFDFNGMFTPHTSGKVKPYGLAGIGYYHRPVSITTPGVGFVTVCDPYWYVCFPDLVSVDQVVGERSSNDFGMNFGGGVNFRMAEHASIYFEVRYHYIWGPEVSIPSAVQPLPGATSTPTKANGTFVPFTVGFRF